MFLKGFRRAKRVTNVSGKRMAVKEWTCSWNRWLGGLFRATKHWPSFYLSFSVPSLSRSASRCLFLFFSLHRFQEFRSCRWQRKSSSIDFAGHVCAWAWWYLNSRSRQKPGPLAACAFVPSTRTRDRHLAFNGDDRRFPLSPSGRVYLISNAVERPRVFTTSLHFIFIAFSSSTPFAFSPRNAPRETSFFETPIHDTCFRFRHIDAPIYRFLCSSIDADGPPGIIERKVLSAMQTR